MIGKINLYISSSAGVRWREVMSVCYPWSCLHKSLYIQPHYTGSELLDMLCLHVTVALLPEAALQSNVSLYIELKCHFMEI